MHCFGVPGCFAVEMLGGRQRRAEALKKLADVAARMSDEQLGELRADIKVRLDSRSGSRPSIPRIPRSAAPRYSRSCGFRPSRTRPLAASVALAFPADPSSRPVFRIIGFVKR